MKYTTSNWIIFFLLNKMELLQYTFSKRIMVLRLPEKRMHLFELDSYFIMEHNTKMKQSKNKACDLFWFVVLHKVL